MRIVALANGLEKSAGTFFKDFELSSAQFNVLNLLANQPDGMRASDLAKALIVDPSNVTGLLKRMSRRGLILALDTPTDRRQHRVALTPDGRSVWERAYPAYESELRALESSIDPADLPALDRALTRIHFQLGDAPSKKPARSRTLARTVRLSPIHRGPSELPVHLI